MLAVLGKIQCKPLSLLLALSIRQNFAAELCVLLESLGLIPLGIFLNFYSKC